MVVVSMAFIGIIVGALLTAAGYAYKMKLQDLNSRDNFYYVERAMEEIYAGVGSETVSDMQKAYIYTVEHMVRYNLDTNAYEYISNDEAEEMFRAQFMQNLSSNPYFTTDLTGRLSGYITDKTVQLDASKLYVQRIFDENDSTKLDKLIIKNVTVTRTVGYNRSVANGDYTQTISADIEIGNPDFDVVFNTKNNSSSNIFNFAMVADMGIEVNQTDPLVITGNIYAASDYYNKEYNTSTSHLWKSETGLASEVYTKNTYNDTAGTGKKYNHTSVTSRTQEQYYNMYASKNADGNIVYAADNMYDGISEHSRYSGLYINQGNVSILADLIIVPGTIAVLNRGSLAVYGKSGTSLAESEIWTDDIVMNGYSSRIGTGENVTYIGPKVDLKANVYVKDDTELNASDSSFKINGSYYGYGDSTERDDRVFGPVVDTKNFQVQVTSGGKVTTENRGHYNSSAIIINGERSVIDLSMTRTLYLAGRSYIELSKNITRTDDTVAITSSSSEYVESLDGDTNPTIVNRQTIEYNPSRDVLNTDGSVRETIYTRDYRTGDSLSIKSNQLAYIPITSRSMPKYDATDDTYYVDLSEDVKDVGFFGAFFPSSVFTKGVPCVVQEISGVKYYYYDFNRAYDIMKAASPLFDDVYENADEYETGFIEAYVGELNKTDTTSNLKPYLTDIRNYSGFEDTTIKFAEGSTSQQVYSTGAITSKSGTRFSIVSNTASVDNLFNSTAYAETDASTKVITEFSDDLDDEYLFLKWNLDHKSTAVGADNSEYTYIENMMADNGLQNPASFITPINRFMNFDKINSTKKLNLASGYYVVTSNESVKVDENGAVRGIIIAKDDVEFGDNVTSFEGLIITGGKIFVNGHMKNISANAEICRTILRECQVSTDEDCKNFLNVFKEYESTAADAGDASLNSTEMKTIDTIDYSDVCKFSNWMKNVE